LCSAARGGAGFQFERLACAKDHRRHTPWLKRMIYADHGIIAIDEDDIDRETHEKHVHPHERREASADEKHPVTRIKMVSSQQTARLSTEAAGILDELAKRGAAGFIDSSNSTAGHRFFPKG